MGPDGQDGERGAPVVPADLLCRSTGTGLLPAVLIAALVVLLLRLGLLFAAGLFVSRLVLLFLALPSCLLLEGRANSPPSSEVSLVNVLPVCSAFPPAE